MSELLFENVPVAIRERDEYVEFGVVIDGAFMPFAARKSGGFHYKLELRKQEAAQAQAPQPPQG